MHKVIFCIKITIVSENSDEWHYYVTFLQMSLMFYLMEDNLFSVSEFNLSWYMYQCVYYIHVFCVCGVLIIGYEDNLGAHRYVIGKRGSTWKKAFSDNCE